MKLTIECNVSIRPDATQEQLDAAYVLDLLFVCDAFCFQVRCIAVQDVDVRRVDVHVGEEVLIHE